MFDGVYRGRRVLVTGHTGFKGSWLCLWLSLGAEITGYALQPPTEPSHFDLLHLDMRSVIGDVRDADRLKKVFREQRPEIVFHLAAQPIVRLSYQDPVGTVTSNVLGTVNVLEAARESGAVRAIINVTSDKCYDNREWAWGYREIDALGGYDPYSASKGCSEIITACWRNSYFNPKHYGTDHHTLLASCRAGNVIGGGDWAVDRLIPDIMRAVNLRQKVQIRNPHATRPWQHVLEPLGGYLLLAMKMLDGKTECAEAWNFGPSEDGNITVGEITALAQKVWPKIMVEKRSSDSQPHEAGMLRLDCSKARTRLQWTALWDGPAAVEKTVQWYRSFYEKAEVRSSEDLRCYISYAQERDIPWVKG